MQKIFYFTFPIVLFIGVLLGNSYNYLFPVATFGLASIYIAIFLPKIKPLGKSKKIIIPLLFLVFLINLFSSILLYFKK
ncbi:DUF5970 family protein [Bacillus sp. FSL K6-0268]|uniref:DUF5970 family protein n=1 Tax=Bacillus sp. FSL K6-0268 TaxID=2921449 RepID=UPI004046E89C